MSLSNDWRKIDRYTLNFFPFLEPDFNEGDIYQHDAFQESIHILASDKAWSNTFFKPFHARYGALEHLGLAIKYPLAHVGMTVFNLLTLNILGAISHAIATPLSFAVFALGFITRALATFHQACFGSSEPQYEEEWDRYNQSSSWI